MSEAVVLSRADFHTFQRLVPVRDRIEASIAELRGKQLACWCPLDKPCHADVLCEIANR